MAGRMALNAVLEVADAFFLMFSGDSRLAVTVETGVTRGVVIRMAGFAVTASPIVVDRKGVLG